MQINIMDALAGLGIISSVAFSMIAVMRSRKLDTTADTRAFVTLEVMLQQLTAKVDDIYRNMDDSRNCTSAVKRDVALNAQKLDALDKRLTKLEEKKA